MAKQRSYLSDVNIALFGGLMNIPVELVPARKTAKKGVDIKMACPECDDAERVKQGYSCDHGHGPFTAGQCDRGMVVKDDDGNETFVRVADDEIDMIRRGEEGERLPEKNLHVQVFPAAEVDGQTMRAGGAYRLRVDEKKAKAQIPLYCLARDLIGDTEKAFVGELNMGLKGGQKMVRLEVRNEQLYLFELIRPQDLADNEVYDEVYDERLLDRGSQWANENVEEFDPDAFADRVQERADQLAAAKTDPDADPVEKSGAEPTPIDRKADALLSMLDAAVSDAA